METKNNVKFTRTPFFGWECLMCGKVVKTSSLAPPKMESSDPPCPNYSPQYFDNVFGIPMTSQIGMHVWIRITPISKLRDKIFPNWKSIERSIKRGTIS